MVCVTRRVIQYFNAQTGQKPPKMAGFLRFTGFLVKNDYLNRLNKFKSSRYRAKKLGPNLVDGNTIPKKFSAQSRSNRVIFVQIITFQKAFSRH